MYLRILSLIFLLIPSIVISEVGFRDLKVGQSFTLVDQHCKKVTDHYQCYGIDDLKFNFMGTQNDDDKITFYRDGDGFRDVLVGNEIYSIFPFCESDDTIIWKCYGNTIIEIRYDKNKIFEIKLLSSSPETLNEISIDVGPLYQSFLDNIIGDPNNPYIKLKKSLESNYQVEWEFTERDRKLFNEGEKDSLWTSYNGGQIFSQIVRKDKYSDLRLFVHYHTETEGKNLSEKRRPKNVNFNDF